MHDTIKLEAEIRVLVEEHLKTVCTENVALE